MLVLSRDEIDGVNLRAAYQLVWIRLLGLVGNP